MTPDLDRLELELRSVPGIVAVCLDGDTDASELLIQTVVLPSMAPPDLRDRIHRIVDANMRDNAQVEIVVDELDGSTE
jgi:hypothetical protein